jgi:hypothetical protein
VEAEGGPAVDFQDLVLEEGRWSGRDRRYRTRTRSGVAEVGRGGERTWLHSKLIQLRESLGGEP